MTGYNLYSMSAVLMWRAGRLKDVHVHAMTTLHFGFGFRELLRLKFDHEGSVPLTEWRFFGRVIQS